jgi:hypothetical protein
MGEKVKGIAHEVVLSVAQKERNRFRPNTVGKVCIFDYAKKKESLSAINVLLAVGLEKERALGILDKHYDEKAFTLDARRSNEGYSQWYKMEAGLHARAIAIYERAVKKEAASKTGQACLVFILEETVIKYLREKHHQAQIRYDQSTSPIKVLSRQANELFKYFRDLKRKHERQAADTLPDVWLFALIAEIMTAYYRLSRFYLPFVNLAAPHEESFIKRRRSLTAIDIKKFIDNIEQKPPSA